MTLVPFLAVAGGWESMLDGTIRTTAPPPPSGFPDATTTGAPAGTVLQTVPDQVSSGTGWVWNAGGWVDINDPGTVFDGFDVNASVNVNADGCTVSNCRVTNSGNDNCVSIRHASNVTVDHCTISGPTAGGADPNRVTAGIKDVYGDATGCIITGNNIFDASGGIALQNGTVTGNYVHDMGYNSTDHVDCYQSFGIGPLEISGNTFFNQNNQTACILLQWTNTAASGVRIHDNLFAGGGYCIYGGDNATDVQITDNHFSTRFYPNGGSFGPLAHWQGGNTGNVWSGNVWYDGPDAGQEITA